MITQKQLLMLAIVFGFIVAACSNSPTVACTAHGVGEMPQCAHLQNGQVMALTQPVRGGQPITDYYQRVPATLATPDGWAATPRRGSAQ